MKIYTCPTCEKDFSSSSSLWNHRHYLRCKKKRTENEDENITPVESEMVGIPEAIDKAYHKLEESDDSAKSISDSDHSSFSEDENEKIDGDEVESKGESEGKSEHELSSEPSSDESEKIDNMIKSTLDYVISHDKEEIEDLLLLLKIFVKKDSLDILKQLSELVHLYYESESLNSEQISPLIFGLIEKLEADGSLSTKMKLIRLKMLVNDITRNRERITQVFTSLNDPSDVKQALKVLYLQNHISNDQYQELLKIDDLELSDIKDILTGTKVGRGELFLPRRSKDILVELHSLIENNSSNEKQILAMINELYQRGCLTHEQYKEIMKEE